MPVKTESQIISSMEKSVATVSPQIRTDADKGPLFYTSIRATAPVIADVSAQVERLALLSTYQFPNNVTTSEMLAATRAFSVGLGQGGFASGLVYVFTGRRPVGTEVFTVAEGDVFATLTSAGSRAISFAAVQSRSLTSTNADAFYNPAARRFEVPILVRALAAGTESNVAPDSIRRILSGGSSAFDGVTNLSSFVGGSVPRSAVEAYTRVQTKLAGLDTSTRGGLLEKVLETDTTAIQAGALTYGSEYPTLFYRLPDGPALDVWLLHTPSPAQAIETKRASSGQTSFQLSSTPVLGLSVVTVNGVSAGATLASDTSLSTAGSTREATTVVLSAPAAANDIVTIAYTYDSVITKAQAAINGYLQADTGELFATDVLVRAATTIPVVVNISGTMLATFDTTTAAEDIAIVVGTFLTQGVDQIAGLGGIRSPSDLRDLIKATVPGIRTLHINVFGRKNLGSIVETIDVPRNAYPVFELTSDLSVSLS